MFTTSLGYTVPHLYEFIGKPPAKWTESDKVLADKYNQTLSQVIALDNLHIQQRERIKTLEAENAFMLRLIQSKMKDTDD